MKNELAVGTREQVIIKKQVVYVVVDVFIFVGRERDFRVFNFAEGKGLFHRLEEQVIFQVTKIADIKHMGCHFSHEIDTIAVFDKAPAPRFQHRKFKMIYFPEVIFYHPFFFDYQCFLWF